MGRLSQLDPVTAIIIGGLILISVILIRDWRKHS